MLEQFPVNVVLKNSENESMHVWLVEAEARRPGVLSMCTLL